MTQPKMSLEDFINAVTKNEIWEIENVANSFISALDLTTQTGNQLDKIGSLVGCFRLGLNDEYYVRKIKAFAIAQNSTGQHDSVKAMIKLVTNASAVTLTNVGNAMINITISTAWTTWAVTNIRLFVESVLAAGIGLLHIFHTGTLSSFEFTDTSIITDSSQGFGDTTQPMTGGQFNYIIT